MQGFNDVLLRTMTLVISSSGEMTGPEVATVRAVYERMTGDAIDEAAGNPLTRCWRPARSTMPASTPPGAGGATRGVGPHHGRPDHTVPGR